jgi:hypothetical protein
LSRWSGTRGSSLSDPFPQASTRPPKELGGTSASVFNPFGHVWSIATHVEDVPPDEMAERAKAAMAAMGSN